MSLRQPFKNLISYILNLKFLLHESNRIQILRKIDRSQNLQTFAPCLYLPPANSRQAKPFTPKQVDIFLIWRFFISIP